MKHTKPQYLVILACLALAVMACACPFSLPGGGLKNSGKGSDGSTGDEDWQTEVDAIRTMTRNMDIPDQLLDENPISIDRLFDPNQLLEPLDHLSMEAGYVLDFVYVNDGLGGYPILYARPKTQPSYSNLEEYQQDMADCGETDETPACNYLNFVISDGSEEGYFQWVLLRMMGDQFYLFWHANYNDAEIIANKDRLNELVTFIEDTDFGYPFSAAQKLKINLINPIPTVTIKDDHVTVRVVWFTKWGGFIESTYTLSREAPHEVINLEMEELVPYDCGVMF
jgi:hypothetical protein